jgi:hypothetical protein
MERNNGWPVEGSFAMVDEEEPMGRRRRRRHTDEPPPPALLSRCHRRTPAISAAGPLLSARVATAAAAIPKKGAQG